MTLAASSGTTGTSGTVNTRTTASITVQTAKAIP
jgi:hypothetical protein